MKALLIFIVILFFAIVSCNKEDDITAPSNDDSGINIEEEIDSIRWDKLGGRAVYFKNGCYLLLNTNNKAVRVITEDEYPFGGAKYNSHDSLLTEMFWNDVSNSCNLIAVDFKGNKHRLYPHLEFDTKVYDWLPDGRIVYMKQSGYIYIDGIELTTDSIYRFYDLACSPDGKKILVSTSYRDSTNKYYQILKIDFPSGNKDTINLFSTETEFLGGSSIEQMRYSPVTEQILYVNHWTNIMGGSGTTLCMVNELPLGMFFNNPNWNPINWKQFTYTSFRGTYLKNGYYGTEILVIPEGSMIAWFN